ncbi:unnamed protein product [marine sediment metagenome]|uniref:Uncharacterized protein n=1 Tax=marine sediment metagenome TaxID=412755 RepID=X1MYI7_9ZZZZ
MNRKFARVIIEGEHFYLKGKIFIPPGYRSRISDVANNKHRFLPVIVEEIKLIGDREPNPFSLSRLPQENRVLIISKDVIHFIVPLEETKDHQLGMEIT